MQRRNFVQSVIGMAALSTVPLRGEAANAVVVDDVQDEHIQLPSKPIKNEKLYSSRGVATNVDPHVFDGTPNDEKWLRENFGPPIDETPKGPCGGAVGPDGPPGPSSNPSPFDGMYVTRAEMNEVLALIAEFASANNALRERVADLEYKLGQLDTIMVEQVQRNVVDETVNEINQRINNGQLMLFAHDGPAHCEIEQLRNRVASLECSTFGGSQG